MNPKDKSEISGFERWNLVIARFCVMIIYMSDQTREKVCIANTDAFIRLIILWKE